VNGYADRFAGLRDALDPKEVCEAARAEADAGEPELPPPPAAVPPSSPDGHPELEPAEVPPLPTPDEPVGPLEHEAERRHGSVPEMIRDLSGDPDMRGFADEMESGARPSIQTPARPAVEPAGGRKPRRKKGGSERC